MNIELQNKDLNLLKIYVVIAEELNLSRASTRLRLSQPALSHALARLRSEFGDPLFVRGSRGLTPTHRSLELLPRVRGIVRECETLYRSAEAQDFERIKRNLILGATTYFEIRVLDVLVEKLIERSPQSTLETRSLIGDLPKVELETGAMDVAVAAYFNKVPENFYMRKLGRDPFVVVTRKRHPYVRGKQNLEAYLAEKHLKIDIPPGSVTYIDRYLGEMGRPRNIVMNLGNFMSPPQVLVASDLLLTCPRSLGLRYQNLYDLDVLEPPVKIEPLEVSMIWHERNHADPFQKWFRDEIAEASKPR